MTSILAGGFATAFAQNAPITPDALANPDADNSKVNQRYDGKVEATADQQSNEKEAIETTRRIRSALTDDKSLSTYAHNIKIIWQNQEIVLKGPVRSADERRSVERIVTKVAGHTKIKSELEITAN
jgi:osmotically-inducible protein OsmY